MQVEVTHDSSAPADVVWAVMTDLERTPDVLSSVTAIERLGDVGGFEVGTSWRETRTMFGRQASEVLTVTSLDAAARGYVLEADNRGTHYVSAASVAPTSEGSRLRMSLRSEATGLAGRLLQRSLGRRFETASRDQLATDLAEIAAAAEADADATAGGAA